MKKLYMVQSLVENHKLQLPFLNEMNLKMSWADGMIGVLPVFSNKKKARRYAGKEYPITEITKNGNN